MFTKYFNRTPLVAFFLFIMVCLLVNHRTTYGQTPTPEPTPPAATGVIIGSVADAVSLVGIAGATISTDPGGYSTLTGENGSFILEVPAGSYTLIASATGYTPSAQPVTVEAGVPTQAVFFLQSETIPGGNSFIFGFVNDENDDALKGVTVTLDGAENSESVETDEEGYYEFKNLSAGNYTLTYEKEGFQSQSLEDISLGENEAKEVETIILEVVVKAKITGYVVDIQGDSIESVKLKLKGIKTGYKSTSSSDADGYFEFDNLEADTYITIAKRKGYKRAKQTITLAEGEQTEIEIEMKTTSKRIIKASVR